MIDFIDPFSGIGGFRLGLERVGGFRCVWSNDWNKNANKVYTEHFGKENHIPDDIRTIETKNIPNHDLLCAGFPCQAFSTSGKRRGFEDTRGTLFFEIARIAEAKRPPLLLLENVWGLLNHDKGHTFRIILEILGELGYFVEWQVLFSFWFGVPQTRPRVFIIGHLGGEPRRTVFPIKEDDLPHFKTTEKRFSPLSNTLTVANADGWNARGTYIVTPKYAGTLTAGGHSGGLHSEMTVVIEINRLKYGESQQDRLYYPNGLAPTILSCRTDDKLKIITEDDRVRRLTEKECERLQGFPDDWTKGISKTRRYECLGNAVTVDVIEFLGKRILSSFTNIPEKENE